MEGLVEPCEQTIMNEAGFVASLVRNAVKPLFMLADAYPSDGAKLMYRKRKTYVQSSSPQTFTLTLSSQERLCNSISWPEVQKSGISWPRVLLV